MSLDLARSIIRQGTIGTSHTPSPTPTKTSTPTPISQAGSTPVTQSKYSDKKLMSPIPTSVMSEHGINTFHLEDGTEFRMDDRGRPVKIERSLTDKQKTSVRGGGSFQDTQKEVDHVIPVALGGTDTKTNLRAAKSKKTISQSVFDYITGKQRLPGEYKPKNRQEGKMVVEWRAIEKYKAGEIGLFEAMGAVRNYDNKEVVNDMLNEDFYKLPNKDKKKNILKIVASLPALFAGGPTALPATPAGKMASDFIGKKVKESRRHGIINDMVGMIGGKHYIDTEDGKSMILQVGEGLDAHQAIVAQETIGKQIESQKDQNETLPTPFIYDTPRRQALSIATAPVRWTAGSLSHFLVNTGLELTGSDAHFTPETELQEFMMGKDDFQRLGSSDDIYGATERFVEDKLDAAGVAHDKSHTYALTSAIVLGTVLEDPFFGAAKEPAKEALEKVMRMGLERELGGAVSKEGLEAITKESERIMAISDKTQRQRVLKEFIETAKTEPEVFRPLAEETTKDAQKLETKAPEFLATAPEKEIRVVETPQTKSLDLLQKATPELDRAGIRDVSLPKIITADATTPLNKKVNMLDYLRTPDRVLEKIGLAPEADAVREGYEGYIKELPKNIDKITQWSKRVLPASNERIFKYLDGEKLDLSAGEKEVAGEIKDWLREWADRLGLPRDSRLANYITHIFDEQFIAKEFDEDLAKIIADKIPGSVYDPFLQKRLGKLGYKQDTWAALDAYVKRATRKVHMDPALFKLEGAASKLEKSQWDYVKSYVDRVNMRPTELDNLVDNGVKQMLGYRLGQRPTMRVTKFLRQMTYRAKLGLNVGSALRNLSQGVNTYAKLGEKYTAIGYMKLLSPENHAELLAEGILDSGFIQDRALSSTKKAMEKIDKGLFFFFEQAERINRGAAYFGGKAKSLAAGATEEQAIKDAKKLVRDTQFTFGSIDTPQALQSDIVKTLAQFQSYTTKQIEFLVEMAQKKEFMGLLRYGVAGTVFVATLGKAFGMKEKELLPTYRLGVPASLALPVAAGKALLDTPDKYGNKRSTQDKLKDVGREAIGLLPASSQIRKTIEGVGAVRSGEAQSKSGKSTLFRVKNTVGNMVKGALFGKFATKEGQQFSKGTYQDPTVDKAKELVALPKEQAAEAYDAYIAEHPGDKDKLNREVRDLQSGITDDEKEMRSLGVADGSRAQAVFQELSKLKTSDEKAELWDDYVVKKILTKEVQQQVLELLGK